MSCGPDSNCRGSQSSAAVEKDSHTRFRDRDGNRTPRLRVYVPDRILLRKSFSGFKYIGSAPWKPCVSVSQLLTNAG